jgi:signal peptidase I
VAGLRRVSAVAGGALLTVAVGALLVLGVGPHVLGYRAVTMLSGSMAPVADAGDLLLVRPQPVDEVRRGQLLTFAAPVPGAPVVTHRVVTVTRTADGTTVTTRGDANAHVDPWRATLRGATVWRAVRVVPHGGQVVTLLRSPAVRVVTVWLLPAWLCVCVLRRLWRRPPGAPATAATATAPKTAAA